MVYQKRPAAPTNTIKLTFDFDTLDRLKAKAGERRTDITRCAYELIQEALGLRVPTQPSSGAPSIEPEDRIGETLNRINQPPRGRA